MRWAAWSKIFSTKILPWIYTPLNILRYNHGGGEKGNRTLNFPTYFLNISHHPSISELNLFFFIFTNGHFKLNEN